MPLGVASHWFRGIKQPKTENKLRQIQNFAVQQKKDFTKIKAFRSEELFGMPAQEEAALGLLSVG